MAFHPAK